MKNPTRSLLRALCCALLFTATLSLAAAPAGEKSRERLVELRAEVARHDELYFRHAAPVITDAEYDALKRELRALEALFPNEAAAKSDAPNVGDDRTGQFPVARHRVSMLSLDKSHSEAELRKFLVRTAKALGDAGTEFIIEPKYDGLAISVTYERGQLRRAVTRGDGVSGDEVTANLLECSDVPRELHATVGATVPELVELRGEVFLLQAEFDRLNTTRRAEGLEPFGHPRNVAVGTLKSNVAAERAGRRLAVVFYGCGAWEPALTAPTSQRQLLETVASWGLPVPQWAHSAQSADAVWREVRDVGQARAQFGFPIDGAVVKVNSVAARTKLGDSPNAPRWAIAYKFEPERVETRLRAITLQVGRTGTVTPVAELEPVELGGSTVARASLHNAAEITRRDYRLGDTVFVEKAGEIVPALVGVNLSRRPSGAAPFEFPARCPTCATALVREGEVAWRCPLRSCPAQVKRRLEHFASDAAVGIRGFGPSVADALVDQGSVTDIDGLYRLTPEQLRRATGGRAKPAENLRAEIERSRGVALGKLFYGLGLPEVGSAAAAKLAARLPSLAALRAAKREDLLSAGLSAAAADALSAELQRPETQAALQRLEEAMRAPVVQRWR